MEYNTNADYDYIEDQGSAAVHQEAVPYHSTGPDVSASTKTVTETSQSRLTGNESVPNVYEAPCTQKFRVSTLNILLLSVCINIIFILNLIIREQVITNFPSQRMFLIVLAFMYQLL